MRDAVIIGSGCAGLIYDRREDLRTGIIPCGGLFLAASCSVRLRLCKAR
jgi:hypothetical protein